MSPSKTKQQEAPGQHRAAARPAERAAPRPGAIGPAVFISYRRSENLLHAALLEASLSALLEPGAVFRDQTAITPGDVFPARIEKAIRGAAVVLVLMGRDWLDLRDAKSGLRRLDRTDDYVRREIEIALEWQRKIVPVLLDGAQVPAAADLPESIAALSTANGVELPWHDGVRQIAAAVSSEVERLAEEIKVPVGATSQANAAARAMEASLHNQGVGRPRLDAAELSATLDRLTDFKRIQGAVLMPDLIYAIDLIGVRASRSATRYVARSKVIGSLDALVESLQRNQTVLAGLNMLSTWFESPASTRDVLDADPRAGPVGGLLCIVSGWNARRREFEVHTFHPAFGKSGVITLTYKAAQQVLDAHQMRLIEAAPMPMPHSLKAQRDLASRLPPEPARRAAAKPAPGARKSKRG